MDISIGQNGTIDVYRKFGEINGSDQELNRYFEAEKAAFGNTTFLYPYKDTYTLSAMISDNEKCRKDSYRSIRRMKDPFILYQAFSEVGNNFEVIDEDTVSVIVPYKEGEDIILSLGGCIDFKEKIKLLRKAQNYSVSIYKSQFFEMVKKEMVFPIGDTRAFALKKEYYNDLIGVTFESHGMDYLGF